MKKIISAVLAFVLVLSMVPVSAIAAETPVTESDHAGAHTAAGHKCQTCGSTEWQEWSSGDTLPTQGHYVLTGNITLTGGISMTGDLHICLNGYVITGKGTGRLIGTNGKTNLTICDCTAYTDAEGAYHAGALTGGVDNSTAGGGAVFVRRGGSFDLYDGRITGNQHKNDSAGGGAVMLQSKNDSYAGGKFYMHGGEITDNKAVKANGSTALYGGAIYANTGSLVEITGGKIANNTGSRGGAIYATGSTVNIKNAVICDNTGGSGTIGLYSKAQLTTENVTFTGNTTTNGSAICGEGGSSANLKDTTITGNTATSTTGYRSAAIYVNSVTLILSGKTVIEGNFTQGANIPDVVLDAASYDTLQIHELTEGSHVIFATPKTEPVEAEEVITLGTAQTEPWQLGWVQYMDAAGELKEIGLEDGKFFFTTMPVEPPHQHNGCNDPACTDHGTVTYQAWTDDKALPTEGSWYLDTDVTVAAVIDLKKNVDLCLNGHTITQKAGSKARMYNSKADAGVKLTIADCTAKTENGVYTAGRITGFANTAEGSVMYLRAGTTLELFDGIIENNTGGSGGAILINGEFKMHGGQFVGNRADEKNGGTLYLNKDSVATITGGAFLNNSAACGGAIYSMGHITIKNTVFTGNSADEGGALFLRSSSAMPNTRNAVLEDVTVTGNTTTQTGAVYLLSSLGSLTLKGNIQIYGNTGKNLYLPKGYTFSAEQIAADAKVGVTAQEMGKPVSNPCADYTQNFISDNTKLQIVYQEGALYLDAAGNHKHCFCAGGSTYCDHEVQTFVEWDDPTDLPTSGNYYLSVDVELPSQITLENTELNLCLNGHRVTLKNRMFYPKGNTTLRICDCTQEPGKITGATRSAILFDKNSTTTLELWNGIFTGNEGESVGGAILLQGNGTFKMYGGKITGNAVISRLKTDEKGDVLLDKNGAQTYTSARGGGGVGVYGENTRFYLYGGEISGNKALSVTYLDKNGKQDEAGGDGGGIYAYKGSVYLYGGTVTDNYAQLHAGGVFTSYAYLEIDGGRISENTTDGGAGGFYAATGSAVLLRSGQISNNRAKGSGGGLVAQGNGTVFTYEGGKVSGNQSEGSAGGILVQSRAEMVMTGGSVTGNYSKGNGGGIYISTKSKLTMTGGSVTGNTAKSQGGGMYLNKATSTISGAYIGNNTAQENLAGGIRMAGGSLTISGAQIVGNRSKGSGCGMVVGSSTNTENGVKVNYYANCYVYNCTFRDNETEGSASGLLLQSKGTKVTVSGCRFYNNRAQSNGGGLYVSTNVEATVKACTFQGNQANRGGSLYASNCKVELKDLTVTENQGGVFITGVNCTATLTGIEVYGNTDKNGAGIRINSGAQVTMTDSRIYNNVTSGTAGGLYVASQSVVKLEKVEVFENQADSAGGFYAGAGATVVAEDLTIRGNSAAGMGGGLYNGANLTISNSKICDNTSGEQGGGVMTWKSSSRWTADDACTRLIGCEILNNRAKGQGGGVFVHRGGPALLRDTLISGNQAELEGGGICSDGKTELENVTVTENRSGKGWAVYLDEADYDGESYFAGYKSIAGNTVIENNQGGDLYLCKGTALAVVGSTLGEKARVDVTLAEGLLTQQVIGVYHYEGEAPRYVLTAGDRSITEPMAAAVEENAETEQPGKSMDIWLYALVGLFVPVIVAVLILFKKKTKKGKEV